MFFISFALLLHTIMLKHFFLAKHSSPIERGIVVGVFVAVVVVVVCRWLYLMLIPSFVPLFHILSANLTSTELNFR